MDALLTNSGEVSIHFDQVISELQRRVGPIHTSSSDCNKFVKIGRRLKQICKIKSSLHGLLVDKVWRGSHSFW